MTSSNETNKQSPQKGSKGKTPGERSHRCPNRDKNGKPRVHNDASWYTKDGVPMIGANFAILQDVDPEPATGLVTETMQHYEVAVVPPVDENNSFWQKVSELYTEIRETNSGAANYTPGVIGCYMLNLMTAYALFFDAAKKILAVPMNDRAAARSSYVLSAAAGNYSYRDMSNNYADRLNDLTLLAKELEVFPVLKTAAMERMKFYFKSIFKDSASKKPTYISFHPGYVGTYSHSTTAGVTTITCSPTTIAHNTDAATWGRNISIIRSVVQYLMTDPAITILRGDIRNAFGNLALPSDLVGEISGGVPIADLTDDIMSKLENASIFWKASAADVGDFTISADPTTGVNAVTLPLAGANDPDLKSRANQDALLINWHKEAAPTQEQLASITRTMSTAVAENHLTRSWWNVTSTDGLILLDIGVVDSFTDTSTTVGFLGQQVINAQGDNAGSLRILMFHASVCDHMPQIFTVKNSVNNPRGYIWDVDNFAVLYRPALHTLNSRVIRSLYDVHPPRGEHGRREKAA